MLLRYHPVQPIKTIEECVDYVLDVNSFVDGDNEEWPVTVHSLSQFSQKLL